MPQLLAAVSPLVGLEDGKIVNTHPAFTWSAQILHVSNVS